MFTSSYSREVRREKYERSDVFVEDTEEPQNDAVYGWENLRELNSRFARYINRARVLEQRNAVFRKQLETLQRLEETSGLEEAFVEQIEVNRQRIRELDSERIKLERELKEACHMLDDYTLKYKNECDFQEHLRGTLENLNREADSALLKNLEYQMECQFLQDDISSTRERHKRNLAEVQTYVSILQQINQALPFAPDASAGVSEEQEKLLAQRKIPALLHQLEEYKSAICQLQAQKQRLQTETSRLDQALKSTQESYEDEIHTYNERIESLRKEIEDAEKSLEKYTSDCRQLAAYQMSLENELERYKKIIESEDNRLNSAIIGTPITLFNSNYRYTHIPTVSTRGKDITQTVQDITNIKPRQKAFGKKGAKKRDLIPKDVIDSTQEQEIEAAGNEVSKIVTSTEGEVRPAAERKERKPAAAGRSPQDVPDGAQISKAFDTLCNIVRDRMRRYQRPEPIADFYTKGRYVLVSGDGSYLDPCFYTSTPSAGRIYVTIRDGVMFPYEPENRRSPTLPPPQPDPRPSPSLPPDSGGRMADNKGEGGGGKGKDGNSAGSGGSANDRSQPGPAPKRDSNKDTPKPAPRGNSTSSSSSSSTSTASSSSFSPDTMSYEKLEVVESVEKFSNDHKLKGYEETSVVMETVIEKSTKKKH